jgi:ABC-type polysaccharide/polyol phosphate transport system ATPase subunit
VGADAGAVIEAEAISKLYPGRPVTIFPPVRSIFEREFGLPGRRSSDKEDADVRARSFAAEEYDLGFEEAEVDQEDEEDDDELDEDETPPARAAGSDEMFWAFRDISLRVPRGGALGVVGGPGAGKSTLLRILAGRAFPTEGRVLVRGRVGPLAADVQKALGLAAKVGGNDIVLASRLVGVEAGIARQHKAEIEELAEPLLTPDGDPARGAALRLAVATTVVLPSDVILLDDLEGMDDEFVTRVTDRLRERLRSGTALVLAARSASSVQQLCGELLVLDAPDAPVNGDRPAKGRAAAIEAAPSLLEGQAPHVPPVVTAFNAVAALLSAEVHTAAGYRSKRFGADDELHVEIRLEAAPGTEIRCGVTFTPREGGTGFRLEHPEPVRILRPRLHVVVARIRCGTLASTAYLVRADATVAGAAQPEPTVIARSAGRIRVDADERGFSEPAEPPVECWDGTSTWPVEGDWSIAQGPRRP